MENKITFSEYVNWKADKAGQTWRVGICTMNKHKPHLPTTQLKDFSEFPY